MDIVLLHRVHIWFHKFLKKSNYHNYVITVGDRASSQFWDPIKVLLKWETEEEIPTKSGEKDQKLKPLSTRKISSVLSFFSKWHIYSSFYLGKKSCFQPHPYYIFVVDTSLHKEERPCVTPKMGHKKRKEAGSRPKTSLKWYIITIHTLWSGDKILSPSLFFPPEEDIVTVQIKNPNVVP